ncbi:GDSL lipase/esterase [Crucibulum laeve]|uniref:GDSL lipase/esterase n=1 Tax=Crucibulum laeve TaxID=68775 RepID=A0A5C3LWA2_9AGAR|nr:GDSL lipase/esterase [Crucibulum laeve]
MSLTSFLPVFATLLLGLFFPVNGKLAWRDTKFLFVFGDSYSAMGFNTSTTAGFIQATPPVTSSNGPNWVQFLGGTYNITETQILNLAVAGATTDAAIVPPKKEVMSLVDQVSQFSQFMAPRPSGAQWESSNTLFAVWIGINDIDFSFSWTNVSHPQLYTNITNRLLTQLDVLYNSGARSFMFLTVPPIDRAPLWTQQGPKMVTQIRPLIADYNRQLIGAVTHFEKSHVDLDTVTIFDTHPIFNTLLDNAQTIGFVNSTGFCLPYLNGTPERTTQIDPCAPVSSYFWLNTLHPLFTVHNILAHAISTVLSA